MNVKLVRNIDYWIGRALCFFLSMVRFISEKNPFRKKKDKKEPKKFLLIELSEMGSAILAYPAMVQLKKKYPQAELFFLTFAKNRASVDILNIIPPQNVLTISERTLFSFIRDFIKFLARAYREKFDVAFDFELFARATAVLTYLSGADTRVGFHKYSMEGLYRGNLLTHKVQYNFQQHISRSFLSFLKVLDESGKHFPAIAGIISEEEIVPAKYEISKEARENIWKKLKSINPDISEKSNLIILNPSGGEIPIRAWSAENYLTLAQKLLQDEKNFVILMGVKKDWELNQKIKSALASERCLNLAGQTTLPELLDLFSVADILVTNDSGPAHFASLTPIKNFVFFGPETPALYAPLGGNTEVFYSRFHCSPCITAFNHRDTICRDNKCLQAFSVDEVYERVNRKI